MIFYYTYRLVPYQIIIKDALSSSKKEQMHRPQRNIMWLEILNWRSPFILTAHKKGNPTEEWVEDYENQGDGEDQENKVPWIN